MKGVRIWLWIGVVMVLIQVIIGGVTRLTGSGLSITEWDVIMGAVPPLNQNDWNIAFEKYKQFPQYNLVNNEMNLAEFKSIFWWEYIHRNWARLIGIVFIIPFLYFLFTKKIKGKLVGQLLIVLLLGALQGVMGWIMVASGLIDKPWVSPYNLTMHLLLALAVYLYLLWLIFSLRDKPIIADHPTANRTIKWVFAAIIIQIIFGGFMAGTKAGLIYNTYPLMNESIFPKGISDSGILMLFENQAIINFIHRTFAIIVAASIIWFLAQNMKYISSTIFQLDNYLLGLVIIQFLLGVITLVSSDGGIPVLLGVLHQLTAFILAGVAIAVLYFSKRRIPE